MTKFIELTLDDGGRVSVNVNRIVSFKEAHYSRGVEFCVIDLDGFSLFVKETYSEVESMVRKVAG